MGCYYCNEPLSSYGFEVINGKEEKVCVTCDNWKHKYLRGEMGTPHENFKVGDKVYCLEWRNWLKGVIYSIEIVKTPKGDMCNYLCYYEHKDCYDENKGMVEDFGWSENIKPRTEEAELVDRNNEYLSFNNTYKEEPRKLGKKTIIQMPYKLLKRIQESTNTQMTLFGGIAK